MNKTTFCDIELIWDEFYWLGQSNTPSDIQLHINSKDEEPLAPHATQIDAWNEFVKNYDTILFEILNRIFNYYREMRPKYLSMGPEWIEHMPEISNAEELVNKITLHSIHISWPYDENTVQLGLLYSCDWEREHGLGVVLESNSVKEVGSADCAIL